MEKLLSSDRIKAEALRLGFSACGLAPAEAVDETVATAFRQWLADGCQGMKLWLPPSVNGWRTVARQRWRICRIMRINGWCWPDNPDWNIQSRGCG